MSLFAAAMLVWLMMAVSVGAEPAAGKKSGVVYLVIAVDTEPYPLDPWTYEQIPDFSCFSDTPGRGKVPCAMEAGWRGCFLDSFGDSLRLSWFVMSHEALRHVPGGSATMVLDTLLKFAPDIKRFHDQIAWHYHHVDWSDPNEDGVSAWNQLVTFDRTGYTDGLDVALAEAQLNHLLVDRDFFPSAIRTGWEWENDAFSRWLEDIFPFDFSANPPNKQTPKKKDPLRNLNDWSRSPREYRGYHPSRDDYQTAGQMRRTIFRVVAPNKASEWRKIFQAALAGKDQLAAITCHSYDNLCLMLDTLLPAFLKTADSAKINIRFATASEAAAAAGGKNALPALNLHIDRSNDTLVITSDSATFQTIPYCVVKTSAGAYRRVFAHRVGPGKWTYVLGEMKGFVFACAVTSRAGVTATARYEDGEP